MTTEVSNYISLVSVSEKKDIDLEPIYQAINAEKGLLHPSLTAIQESYRKGLAVGMLSNDQIVGFVRFSPLLDEQLKIDLGLTLEFPNIWEVGSAIITAGFRGGGLYASLRNTLVRKYIKDIQEDRLLILGTTKTIPVLKSLSKAQSIGVFLQPCFHLDYPMIAAFTCVCKGSFGQGFQDGENCTSRTQKENVPIDNDLSLIVQNKDGNIPCNMYTSSSELAMKINHTLMDLFGSSGELVRSLKRTGYY